MKTSIKIIFLLSIILILFVSCLNKSRDKHKQWKIIAEKTVEQFSGKKMYFADTLTRISYNTLDSALVHKGIKPVLKVVVFIDGTCGACLINLNFWQSFITNVYQKRNDCFFYVCVNWQNEMNGTSNPLLDCGFTYSWYLDKNCSLFRSYEIYDKRLQAVLLDQKNEVLLIGEPSLNSQLGELYLSTIINY